ncbi:unnamed protein product, partial [Gulo gulo]
MVTQITFIPSHWTFSHVSILQVQTFFLWSFCPLSDLVGCISGLQRH